MSSSFKIHLMYIRTILIACLYFDILGMVGINVLEESTFCHSCKAVKQQYPSSRKFQNICFCESPKYYKYSFLIILHVVHPCSQFVLLCVCVAHTRTYIHIHTHFAEKVLSAVGKVKHLIWKEIFKILNMRIYHNLLSHSTYFPESHLKVALH
jgi:hypothetical protein